MVMGSLRQEAEVAVIGAGPGGYVTALRLADLGREVVLVDARPAPGGVCLHEGCIPSKTLIHAVGLLESIKHAESIGLSVKEARLDPEILRRHCAEVVAGLAGGITQLLRRRGVEVVHGRARFVGDKSIAIEGADTAGIDFKQAVIATGSRVKTLPAAGDLPVWSSTEALALPRVPQHLLIIGGGYIGLELGLVYAGLGSKITMVEFFPRLLPGADPDLVDVMLRHVRTRLDNIMIDSTVKAVRRSGEGFVVDVQAAGHGGELQHIEADQVLVAVGRRPNTDELGLSDIGIAVDQHGLIPVDAQGRTARPHIFAIGDVTPGPMLAHRASRAGKVAAEVIANEPAANDNRAIPAVVYTDPEIAWTGLTETEAKAEGIAYKVGKFPLAALGRARTLGRTDGLVKLLFSPDTSLVLGLGVVGPQASELVAEGTLAIEMGATLEDLLVTIHPHPTLSEAVLEAAEVAAGKPVHILGQKGGSSPTLSAPKQNAE